MEKDKVQNDIVKSDDEISSEDLERVNGGVASGRGINFKIEIDETSNYLKFDLQRQK